jgi:hypothetical protein
VRDKVSHSHKTTGKIIVLNIFNLHISRQQMGTQKILNCMVTSIPLIQSAPDFLMNAVLVR